VRFSKTSLSAGVETHWIERQVVKVYSVPNTLADLFKYRNKVGLETVVAELARFLLPPLAGVAGGTDFDAAWSPGGPWRP
jgi:hypothetical protein